MWKRTFDLTLCLLSSPVWVPVMAFCALMIWCFEGRPVFYVSRRRVFKDRSISVLKFRAMVTDADKLANRETVPIDGVRFLNIPPDSPLYTRTGRIIERLHLTELPQLIHVILGEMTLVGNRPLPEDVIAALREDFPEAEDRFLVRSGLTGPVQLVGRNRLTDEERLGLEIDYCRRCLNTYSITLDIVVFARTVLSVLGILRFLSPEEVHRLIERCTKISSSHYARATDRSILSATETQRLSAVKQRSRSD